MDGKPCAVLIRPRGSRRRAITTFLGDRDDVSDRVLDMILHHTRDDVTGAHYDKARREKQLRKAWQLWANQIEKVVG